NVIDKVRLLPKPQTAKQLRGREILGVGDGPGAVLAERVEYIPQHGPDSLRRQSTTLVRRRKGDAQFHLPRVACKEVDAAVADDFAEFQRGQRQLKPRAGRVRA